MSAEKKTDWRQKVELERLRLARKELEFRMNETVAFLAIELGRNGPGRGGKNFTPDLARAARLLADAERARQTERARPEKELKEYEERMWSDYFAETDPPLTWHHAKRGVKPGSGGRVSCAVLCNPKSGPDVRIHAGRLFPDGWERAGTWEVMRDENRFRAIVRDALAAERIRLKPEGETRPVTQSEVLEVLQLPVINPDFFRALVTARRSSERPTVRASADAGPKPPRGKRKGGS